MTSGHDSNSKQIEAVVQPEITAAKAGSDSVTIPPKAHAEQELERQERKFMALMARIERARRMRCAYVCEGAKEIALLRWQDERRYKRVFNEACNDMPPYESRRLGMRLRLDVERYQAWAKQMNRT